MKNKLLSLAILFCAIIIILPIFSGSVKSASNEESLYLTNGKDAYYLQKKDTITIALRDEKRPLMYIKNQEVMGVYPDIFNELGRISGLNIKYKIFEEDVSYQEMMKDKDVDFVTADYCTLSSEEKENCTNNILEGSYMAVIRENENIDIDKEITVSLMEYQRNNEKTLKKPGQILSSFIMMI